MEKIIIVAVAKNNVIGNNGTIPWHSKEELQHFKNTTMGSPIIMGRKTFESIKKPLKGRTNIVISRNENLKYDFDEIKIFKSLENAYEFCENELKPEKVFIIGGGEIYKEAMKDADKIRISRMNLSAEGDVFFSEIDEIMWEKTSSESYQEFEVEVYERRLKDWKDSKIKRK